MNVNLYVIYDRVAESVQGGVHCFPHDAVAVRFFRDVMDAPDTSLNKHPQDYDLLGIGQFDVSVPCVLPEVSRTILTGASIVAMRSDSGVSV